MTKTENSLLYFTAEWCGPCRVMKPLFEEVSKNMQDTVAMQKINIDNNPELAQQYRVNSIPTFIVLKAGVEVARTKGAMSKKLFTEFVTSSL